jgi:hypothetical protein
MKIRVLIALALMALLAASSRTVARSSPEEVIPLTVNTFSEKILPSLSVPKMRTGISLRGAAPAHYSSNLANAQ